MAVRTPAGVSRRAPRAVTPRTICYPRPTHPNLQGSLMA